MITVYGYGFEVPKPPEPRGPGLATYAIAALAAWWAWTKWGKPARVSNPGRRRRNPRRRRTYRRRRNPVVRFRVGDYVSAPWFPQGKGRGNRVRAKVVSIAGGRAIVRFPRGNMNDVPTGGLRRVK